MHTNMFKTYKMFTKVCRFVQQDTARCIPSINVSTHSLSLHSDNNLSGYEGSLKQAQKKSLTHKMFPKVLNPPPQTCKKMISASLPLTRTEVICSTALEWYPRNEWRSAGEADKTEQL